MIIVKKSEFEEAGGETPCGIRGRGLQGPRLECLQTPLRIFLLKSLTLYCIYPHQNILEAEETRAVAVGGGWSGRPGLSAGAADKLSDSLTFT